MYDAPDFVLNREKFMDSGALFSCRALELRKLHCIVTGANNPVVVPAVWKLKADNVDIWSSPPIASATEGEVLVFDLGEIVVPAFKSITFNCDEQEVLSNKPVLEYGYVVNGS